MASSRDAAWFMGPQLFRITLARDDFGRRRHCTTLLFDAYTIVFGIRNVTDIPAALREAHRVLKRGGRFYCMEFSSSDWPGFSDAYDAWASKVIPRIGKAVADDEDSYRYLVESIRRFPKPPAFRAMVADAGFVRAAADPMLGGLVTIHSGWKI